jgi:hypothetical protein
LELYSMTQEVDAPAVATDTATETPEPASPGTVDAGTTEPAAPVAESDEQKAARKATEKLERAQRAISRRFSEVTEEKRALARQVEQLTTALVGQKTQPPQADADPEPKKDDPKFSDWEAWHADHTRWLARQEAKAVNEAYSKRAHEQQAHSNLQQHATEVAKAHAKRMTEFAAKTPDFDAVLDNDDVQFSDAQATEMAALVAVLPNGPEVLYAIGKNPALAESLHGKSGPLLGFELGKIAAAISAARAPQVSNAPPPSEPVATRGSPSKDVRNMTPDEYYAHITRSHRKR